MKLNLITRKRIERLKDRDEGEYEQSQQKSDNDFLYDDSKYNEGLDMDQQNEDFY